MVKRTSNVPFHLPVINELQLRCFSCFVYKQLSLSSICILTYVIRKKNPCQWRATRGMGTSGSIYHQGWVDQKLVNVNVQHYFF